MIGYQFLIEIDALNAADEVVTLRFCCREPYAGGGYEWAPRIIDPGLVQNTLFSGSKITGSSSSSYGEIVINNLKSIYDQNGPSDNLLNYEYYGRPARMYCGLTNGAFPSEFPRAYTVTIENITEIGSGETVSLTLKGLQSVLDVAFNTTKFLGNNVAPNGLEGDSTLKDQLKPVLLGRCYHFTPTLCNSQKLIYAVSPITGLAVDEMGADLRVYDSRVLLGFAGKRTSAQLLTDAPPAGSYYASEDGYVRLGAKTVGTLTISGAQLGYGLISKTTSLVAYVLTAAGFSSMVDSSTYTLFSDTSERGLYTKDSITISEIIDRFVAPVGFWYFTNDGIVCLSTLKDPANETSKYLFKADTNITSLRFKRPQDTKAGIPAKTVTVKYGKNYTVETTTAGSVSAADQEWAKSEWRKTTVAAMGVAHPMGEDLEYESTYTREPDITTFAGFLTNRRMLVELGIFKNEFLQASSLLPGDCVTLDLLGRYGISSKKMIIAAILKNYAEEDVTVTLWG